MRLPRYFEGSRSSLGIETSVGFIITPQEFQWVLPGVAEGGKV